MIYKGCQKKMIKIKNPESRFFEEAYFILKEECDGDETDIKDMVEEANRIIGNSIRKKQKKRPKIRGVIIAASCAAFCSFILSIVLLIIK